MLKLTVVVPTYRRPDLLRRCLLSFLSAKMPANLSVDVLVIDNNSQDGTPAMVSGMVPDFTGSLQLRLVPELRQGLSNARNCGIRHATAADLIGFIDDDEEIGPEWLEVVEREFRDPAVSFIGGPYLPNWVSEAPSWLPPGYHAAIGAIPPKPRSSFGDQFGGNLMGGNAVFRPQVFDTVGVYNPQLGRSGKGLLSDEDAEFFRRVRAADLHGMYVPDLEILHYIAPERLTRDYHRRWAYWRAVSQGMADRAAREPVPYLLGIPRHRLGRAWRSLLHLPTHRWKRTDPGPAFAEELDLWEVAGFFQGKYLAKAERLYAPQS